MGVLYYTGDLERDPTLENYPCAEVDFATRCSDVAV